MIYLLLLPILFGFAFAFISLFPIGRYKQLRQKARRLLFKQNKCQVRDAAIRVLELLKQNSETKNLDLRKTIYDALELYLNATIKARDMCKPKNSEERYSIMTKVENNLQKIEELLAEKGDGTLAQLDALSVALQRRLDLDERIKSEMEGVLP